MTAPEQAELFHVDEPPRVEDQPTALALSADRRRTARQRADVGRGVHPLMGGKTRPELGTCGDCAHRRRDIVERGFPKCGVGPITHGANTDVRAWWPACGRFEAKP